MNSFEFQSEKARQCNPEGHNKSFVARFDHQFNIEEDTIRNCDHIPEIVQRMKKWVILLNIEKQRLSTGLLCFYDEIELDAIRVDKCNQNFDELHQKYIKQKKGKEIEQPQLLPAQKGSASEPKMSV